MLNLETTRKIPARLFLVLYVLTSCSFHLDAQQYQLHYMNELIPDNIDIDSSRKFLQTKLDETIEQQDTTREIKYLLASSSFNRYKLNYNAAFENAGKALMLANEFDSPELKARAHDNIGVLNLLFQQIKQAGKHFTKSLHYYELAYKKKHISKSDLFYPNYNLMIYSRYNKDQSQFNLYVKTCTEIINTSKTDPCYQILIDIEKAKHYKSLHNYQDSESLFLSSIKAAQALNKNPYHHNLMMLVYAKTARLYEAMGKQELMGKYFKKAIESIQINGNQAFFIVDLHAAYASWLYQHGDTDNAYLHENKARQLNARYQGARRLVNKGFLIVRDHYSEELQKKDEEINRKNLELANNKQQILRIRIILVIVLFLIAIAAIILRNRIRYLKIKKEKELTQKSEEESKELLEHRNRELTASMLQLIEKDEIIRSVRTHLKDTNNSAQTIKYLDSIKKQSVSLWDAFNKRFTEQNADFYKRLQEKVPDLSANDIKLCALIKLNFSSKEMSSLLGISTASLHVARHRLRKKMNIEREVVLFDFINSI